MQGRLQEIINHYRELLLEHEEAAEQELSASYASVSSALKARLEGLYEAIEGRMENGLDVPEAWLLQVLRESTLLQFLQDEIDRFALLALNRTRQAQGNLVMLGQMAALDLLRASLPRDIDYAFGVPSPTVLSRLVGATQNGSPLETLFSRFGKEAAETVKHILLTGVSLGQNPRAYASQVATALQVPRWRAETIARTESIRAYRGASQETYRANRDIIRGWRWTCARQKRTCIACIAMDGSIHELDEEMGSHPRCRCVPVPITASWEEILGPLGIDPSSIPDRRPHLEEAAQWFERQNDATKLAILGNQAAFRLYKDGKVTVQDFLGRTFSRDWGHSIYQKSVSEIVKKGEKGD